MDGYKAVINESSRELNAKERIKFKNITNAVSIDELSTEKEFNNETFLINVDGYIVLEIHNEKSDNEDYLNYLIFDKDGTVYKTGSESFFRQFKDMYTEMEEAGEIDDFSIVVIRRPSKNYSGKSFLTCQIV